MSSSHYRYECKHGRVVRQCRCPGPHEMRMAPCPSSCPPDYEPKHDIDTQAPVLTCYPRPHTMVQTSKGSRVFACMRGRVNVQPMIGDPAPGRHRKVDA